MPARNVVKIYAANGIYHIYNRGVEKRKIFLDDHDYRVFLNILKEALSNPTTLPMKRNSLQGPTLQWQRMPKNFYQQIELFAYCLMPNHFHLLLKQQKEYGIKEFLHSIMTRYSIYFNKKHKRVGPLFQSNYKATMVTEEPYLLHLTRYIHLNPKEHFTDLFKAFSSYADYLEKRNTAWLNPRYILEFFSPGTLPLLKKHHTYKDFVQSYKTDSAKLLGSLILEDSE
ncbi:hypothetical protein A3A64_02860 [Candidatus Gottesmanbacteria bacterium RIFCSPLOWO2_01_FULL_48_11]|uniref:Transposase IS200-like domain-containing protein n=1 Tax=Candidatus Gottesmanbacteria bacterium RIFCSPLOWO2_01_FULL_48_11 TaxID=1798395 RepID=A0A1F6ASS6_9BACT|nr:MAG: hypothetical protein A3A64_02860 [Candidatus Gottesmanbacteria bacterium RIFCSPLOWO2_01_FULL_48_11]